MFSLCLIHTFENTIHAMSKYFTCIIFRLLLVQIAWLLIGLSLHLTESDEFEEISFGIICLLKLGY